MHADILLNICQYVAELHFTGQQVFVTTLQIGNNRLLHVRYIVFTIVLAIYEKCDVGQVPESI